MSERAGCITEMFVGRIFNPSYNWAEERALMTEPTSPRIISPDVHREQRIPPRQALTRKWPVLHAGTTPDFDRAKWSFHIWGLVEKPWQCTYDEFLALPRIEVIADMHCVTRWSKLDNVWEGVSTREVLSK